MLTHARCLLLLLALAGPGRGLAAEEAAGSAPPIARVWVEQDGFVRVRAPALRALGFRDDQNLEAEHRGVRLPMHTRRVGDDVVFLVPPGLTSSLRPRAVRLAVARTNVPAAQDPLPSAPPPASALLGTDVGPRLLRHAGAGGLFAELPAFERALYDPAAPPPTWFLARVEPERPWSVAVDAASLPGSTQRLLLRCWSTRGAAPRIEARCAGVSLGVREGAGRGPADLAWDLPSADTAAQVTFHDVGTATEYPVHDASEGRLTTWIETLSWEGVVSALPPRGLVSWVGGGEPWTLVRVGAGGEGLRVLASAGAEGSARALEVRARADGAVFVRTPPAAGTAVIASLETFDVAPEPLPAPPDPLAEARGASHVIVATQSTLPGARRLAAHRASTGLPSVAVALRDVAAAFADGENDPLALRRFLAELNAAGPHAALRYVLLCGDAVRDRADRAPFETIPALLARTMYNGATPADALYVERPGREDWRAPVVGRLPFREAAAMDAFVDRLLAYELAPPADASRHRLAFLANEARFGPVVDRMIEGFFRGLVARAVPPDFDVELTFASARSPYLWPPREFNDKVIGDLNRGALFYTYVGHGFAQGFDSLHVGRERLPVLHLADVERVAVRGTPPVVLSIACTTAEFDHPTRAGLGEALLARPAGPIAYVGATRVCHPAGNTFLGRSFARAMFRDGVSGTRRLGDVWADARDEVLDSRHDDRTELALLTVGTLSVLPPGTSLERVKREAFWLYNLLGDPATRLALPEAPLTVAVRRDGEALEVTVTGAPEGAQVRVDLLLPRGRGHPDRPPTPVAEPMSPEAAPAIRTNHERANDCGVRSATARAAAGPLSVRLSPAAGERSLSDPALGGVFHVRAWCSSPGSVRLGSTTLNLALESPDGAGR